MRREVILLAITSAVTGVVYILGRNEFTLNSGLAVVMIMILWGLVLMFYLVGWRAGYDCCEKRKAEEYAQTIMGYEKRLMEKRFGRRQQEEARSGTVPKAKGVKDRSNFGAGPATWAENLGKALRREDDLGDNFGEEESDPEIDQSARRGPPPKDWIN